VTGIPGADRRWFLADSVAGVSYSRLCAGTKMPALLVRLSQAMTPIGKTFGACGGGYIPRVIARGPRSAAARLTMGAVACALVTAVLAIAPPSGAAAAVRAGTAGAFGRAVELPPPPQRPAAGRADSLGAVSCAQPSWCGAGGEYFNPAGNLLPMVTAQVRGRWTPPVELQLPDNRATQERSSIFGTACTSPGNCAVVGDYVYSGGSGRYTAFIAADVGGAWQPAFEAWLPANTAKPPFAALNSVSCSSRRSCAAVGEYFDTAGNEQLMADTGVHLGSSCH
jgi:hypothetical protein